MAQRLVRCGERAEGHAADAAGQLGAEDRVDDAAGVDGVSRLPSPAGAGES